MKNKMCFVIIVILSIIFNSAFSYDKFLTLYYFDNIIINEIYSFYIAKK